MLSMVTLEGVLVFLSGDFELSFLLNFPLLLNYYEA